MKDPSTLKRPTIGKVTSAQWLPIARQDEIPHFSNFGAYRKVPLRRPQVVQEEVADCRRKACEGPP